MPQKQRWNIPDDWSGDDWMFVYGCIPNSRQWRGVFRGAVYNLTRGRNWDETTGNILDAQQTGREIYEGFKMDCDQNFDRIAIALEAINDKMPELVGIDDFIEGLTNVGGLNFEEIEALLNILGVLPGIDIKFEPVEFLFKFLRWKALLIAQATQATAQTTMAGAMVTGEALQQMISAIGTLGPYAQLIIGALLGSDVLGSVLQTVLDFIFDTDEAGDGNEIRNINNILLNQEAIMQTVSVVQNCGAGCGGGGGGDGTFGCSMWIADQSAIESVIDDLETGYSQADTYPPAGFDTWNDYYANKCAVSNAMVLAYAERLGQLSDLGKRTWEQSTYALTLRTIERLIYGLDVLAAQLLKPLPPMFNYDPSDPLVVAVRSWVAQQIVDQIYPDVATDSFGVLDFVRIQIILNREDMVCSLYSAFNTSQARLEFLDIVEGYCDDSPFDAEFQAWGKVIMQEILSNAWLNLLFTSASFGNIYADETAVDCQVACVGACQEAYVQKGTYLGSNIYESLDRSDASYVEVWFWQDVAGVSCGPNKLLTISGPNGITDPPSEVRYRVASTTNTGIGTLGWDLYYSNTLPTQQFCAKRVRIKSSTPFTITLTLAGDCTPQ